MLVFDAVLLIVLMPAFLSAAYLFVLTLLSRTPQEIASTSTDFNFDVIVPAHNEEAGIAETVRSLSSVDYPEAQRRIVVVADNCTDDTAAHARRAGAVVLERNDLGCRGKGYALQHAYAHSANDGFADAVVVVDADTVVSRNLLTAFAARLAAGERAVQADYCVRNPTASWRTRLMSLAFALFHEVRSNARERLGLSAGLRGNGMCFTLGVLRKVPHDAFSVVEDVEYGIALGRKGVRVAYASEAKVFGDMVASEKASRSQRQRWEGGRVRLMLSHGLPLLRDAWRNRSLLLLDLALDLLVPPLSWVVLMVMVLGGAAAALGFAAGSVPLSLVVAVVSPLFLTAYVLRGWWISGLGIRGLFTLLLGAPRYLIWKVGLVARSDGRQSGEWVRTARPGDGR